MIEQEETPIEGIVITTREALQDAKLLWKSIPEVDKVTKQDAFNKIQALWKLLVDEMGELKCKR